MSDANLNLLDLRQGKIQILHLSWFAFFLTFLVWFNHAPLLAYMRDALELTDALIVNPYATERFADAICDAVEMPVEERRRRMTQMRSIVRENNIYKWAAHLLVDLMQGTRRSQRPLAST